MAAQYANRDEAGQVLVERLQVLSLSKAPLVLAIPNGGLAVAIPIAKQLGADLDLLIVRKLQIPYNPEAGFGAITSLGTVILNRPLVARIGLSEPEIEQVIIQTRNQIKSRQATYRGLVGHYSPANRVVVLVDDGLASGYTMLAAIESVQQQAPEKVLVAVPTASASAISKVREVVDTIICPHIGKGYVFAVADAYHNWYDVSDEEVMNLLREIRTLE
jgi:predicted phosphoribosyltransferase